MFETPSRMDLNEGMSQWRKLVCTDTGKGVDILLLLSVDRVFQDSVYRLWVVYNGQW